LREMAPESKCRISLTGLLTMVLVAACLGLRASEIMGLQVAGFQLGGSHGPDSAGVVNGRSGDTKTEASQKPLPIDPRLASSLKELWQGSSYKGPQDWVFSKSHWPTRAQQDILRRHLRFGGVTGWNREDRLAHFSAFVLNDVARCRHRHQGANKNCFGTPPSQSTMNIYTQAVSEQKRIANSVVVGVLFNENCPCGVAFQQRGANRQ